MKAPDSRFTIGNVMILVALTGLGLGVIVTPGTFPVLGGLVILLAVSGFAAFLLIRRVLDLASGLACPNCGRRGLERRAVLSFGERFFLCPHCGIRCRRALSGEFVRSLLGLDVWEDASAPEYDAFYQKAVAEDPWNAPPGLEDEDLIYSKTHLNLIHSKRQRRPENPNGPGLE